MEERIRTIDRLKSTDSVEHLPIETTPNSRVDALKSTIRAANRRGACQSAPGRTQQKIARFSPPRPSKSDASADLELFRVAPEKAFFNGIDPLLPLVGWGSRCSRIWLTSSKRPFEGVDECAPARSDAPIIEGCYTDPQMTECLEIIRLMLTAACQHYQFITGRQRPVNHC
jgi:hypothetical protein